MIANLTDIEAIEQTPLDERPLPPNTYAALQQGAALNPDKIALCFFLQGTRFQDSFYYTYKDLLELITQTANMFHELGVGPTDVVSMILPNLPQTFFTLFGGEAAGIINPINPLLEPEVMADIMRAAGTKVLVTLAPFPQTDIWQKVLSIADDVPTLETILQVDMIHYLSGVKKWGAKWLRRNMKQLPQRVKVYDFGHSARQFPPDRLISKRVIQPDDVASYFHTGGTTGIPKIAQHTHFNEVYNAWAAAQNITQGTAEADAQNVVFAGLPLFHVNGFVVTGITPLSTGATVVLGTPAGYRGEGIFPNFWRIIDHYQVTYFSAVPTVFSVLLNVPLEDADVSTLQYAVCGAAPMPVEVFTEFEARTGLRILEGYGLTEGACVCSVNPAAGERRVGSIGYRLPYQEMKTVLLDDRGQYVRDCAADEIGVVVVRGPNVFLGYKEERHNEGLWIDTGDGRSAWLNTGDLGRVDGDGYFWLTGRKKELIIRGGHNIDPKQIEEPLYEHPAVALVAAVGRPDARAGELPVAYVQLKEGAVVTEAELLAFAQEHIGERAAVPKQIHIVEALPLTAVGKIFKPPLVRQEVVEVYKAVVQQIAGVAQASVIARADKILGTVADITIEVAAGAEHTAVRTAVEQALGQFTIPYTVQIS